MGRKEGGSLFHQMINVPDVFTYSHRTDKDGNAMAVSDQTRKNYQNWLHKSADYFSAHHYIRPQQAFKVGIFWPFYVQPKRASASGGATELRSSQE